MTIDRNEQARRNRERMPLTAALIDAFRERFGAVRVVWAKEGEVEVGKRSADSLRLEAQRRAAA